MITHGSSSEYSISGKKSIALTISAHHIVSLISNFLKFLDQSERILLVCLLFLVKTNQTCFDSCKLFVAIKSKNDDERTLLLKII